jgi:GT2 family glycosyltransferase
VVKYSQEATVYIADNASGDDSIAFVKTHFPTAKIISNDGNFGYAKGYNDALRFVEEDIYVLVNSDIEVTQNWLAPIIEIFESQPETAIVQPKILDYKNQDYFEYAGAGGGFIDKYGYPFCRGRIFNTLEKDFGQYDDETDIFWASGACFFIRKAVYRELGGFDADFFAHQEEIDLCWRAFNKNHKVKYCGKSTVYHVGGATLNSHNPKKTYLNFRNSLYAIIRNVPKSSLISTLLIRLLLDGVAGLHFLSQGKVNHVFAIIRAHFTCYWNFLRQYRKRDDFGNGKYFLVNSIVIQYFINKKKRFTALF